MSRRKRRVDNDFAVGPREFARDWVGVEGCFLTRRRGGAEEDAENAFLGLASVLGASGRKVKT